MTQLDRFILHPMTGKIFLSLLVGTYLVYLVAFGHGLSTSLFGPHETIIEQPVNTTPTSQSNIGQLRVCNPPVTLISKSV